MLKLTNYSQNANMYTWKVFMNIKEMEKLTRHFDKYFEQTDSQVLHPVVSGESHIDALLYKPTPKYPFWKLATMGASDYRLPHKNAVAQYNEYIMFIDQSIDMLNTITASWYYFKLIDIASFAKNNSSNITYGHSLEWSNTNEEMVGAYIDMPQIIIDAGILRCKLGLLKTVACLQVVLLNKAEINYLLKVGTERFSSFLYPEDKNAKFHYLSEQTRTDKF